MLVEASQWQPVGIKELEPAADQAVRALSNTLVVAGPGAGKTELLAQRACFLLQTGICARPHRILAISFKRDAARNLGDRVRLRCGDDLSARFDSFTFDSFAKRLVDHFLSGLPQPWRPTKDYEMKLKEVNWRPTTRISVEPPEATALWKKFLHEKKPSWMNFPMLSVLAEYILAVNPFVLTGLRRTYSFVFLDEFQDTTDLQYQLTLTAFLGSAAILTAVGDPKQTIMQWAGALVGIFARFKSDFASSVLRPTLNHRSVPKLIRIQAFLAAALEKKDLPKAPAEDSSDDRGECRIFSFEDSNAEARFLASWVKSWIDEAGLLPRDICILTRNRPPEYTGQLQNQLRNLGITARIESELQDLLAEPLTSMLVNFLRFGAEDRAPASWANALDILRRTSGCDSEESQREIERALSKFVKQFRLLLQKTGSNSQDIHKALSAIVSFVGRETFQALHPQYAQGDYFRTTIGQLVSYLSQFRKTLEWDEALGELEGTNAVPIMTIHKSKGLEYHTVVFVGFEDSAFWNFHKKPTEETCTFFVAFSRAKNRVVFTFCERRAKPADAPLELQQRTRVGPLYNLLEQAGVSIEHITE
jgi:DNA helicase II / ATP-dependent DNA helicase PcrA